MSPISEPPSAIQCLAQVDILEPVMACLPLKYLKAPRLVSRTWYYASCRQFYTGILRDLRHDREQHGRFYSEKRDEDMSSDELKEQFMRLNDATKSWDSETGAPGTIRPFTIPNGYDNVTFKLVLGGEWAIAVNPSGKVIYFDLHANKKDAQENVLIESQSHGRSQFKFMIDEEAGHIPKEPGFNIAFSFINQGSTDPSDPRDLHEMRIWHVKPDTQKQPDGSYLVCGLSANLVSSFFHHPEVAAVTSLSLYESRVAFSTVYTNMDRYTFIVDWENEAKITATDARLCSWFVLEHIPFKEDSIPMASSFSDHNAHEVHLLPLHWAFVRNGSKLVIHELIDWSLIRLSDADPSTLPECIPHPHIRTHTTGPSNRNHRLSHAKSRHTIRLITGYPDVFHTMLLFSEDGKFYYGVCITDEWPGPEQDGGDILVYGEHRDSVQTPLGPVDYDEDLPGLLHFITNPEGENITKKIESIIQVRPSDVVEVISDSSDSENMLSDSEDVPADQEDIPGDQEDIPADPEAIPVQEISPRVVEFADARLRQASIVAANWPSARLILMSPERGTDAHCLATLYRITRYSGRLQCTVRYGLNYVAE